MGGLTIVKYTITIFLKIERFIQKTNFLFLLTVTVRKFSNPSGGFKGQHDFLGSIKNKTFRFEIETPVGTQIVLNLTEFNNNYNQLEFRQPTTESPDIAKSMVCASPDHIIVGLNKQTDRLGSLCTENTNPKICDSI